MAPGGASAREPSTSAGKFGALASSDPTLSKPVFIFTTQLCFAFQQPPNITKRYTSTSDFGDGRISTHTDPMSTCRANLIDTPWSHQLDHSSSFMRWPIRLILGFWESKVHKNGNTNF